MNHHSKRNLERKKKSAKSKVWLASPTAHIVRTMQQQLNVILFLYILCQNATQSGKKACNRSILDPSRDATLCVCVAAVPYQQHQQLCFNGLGKGLV